VSTFKLEPHPHQHEALRRMQGKPEYAVLAGVGTGKGKIAVDDTAYLYRQGAIDTAIYLAPIGVHNDAWIGDARDPGLIPQHLPDDIDRVVAFTSSGRVDSGLRALFEAGPTRALKIACVNYEALSSGGTAQIVANLIKQSKRGVYLLADESQRCRTPGAKRTKVAWRYGQLAQFKRITTGSAISNGWHDLYAQYKILGPHIIGVNTYAEFKAEFCIEQRFDRFSKIVGYRNVAELERRIAPYTYQINKDQCLNLPPQTWQERPVTLSDEQRRVYKALAEDFLLELSNGKVLETDQAVTRMLRLQQVLCGHLPDLNGGTTELPCPRIDETVEVVRESDGKVIIWCRFIPDRDRLVRALAAEGIGSAVYEGSDASAALAKWRAQDSCKVLIGNPVKGGLGLTLNEASVMIHYSLSFNYEDLEQSEGRNHRIGQDKNTTCVTMRAPRTVDDRIIKTLRGKRNVADALRSSREIESFIRAVA
jgi:hypothetical protein